MNDVQILPPITRSTDGLKQALFDEIDGIRQGRSDYKQALAVAMVATAIIRIMNVEYVRSYKLRAANA